MFNSLEGIVSGKEAGLVFLQCGPIEWSLHVSAVALAKLPHPGEKTRIFTYLHHKEDTMALYGFYSEEERELFHNLNKVDGIGPKQALKILSALETSALVNAIETEDIGILKALPGIGPKTAGKLLLTLKGKLVMPTREENDTFPDLTASLVLMGFDRKKVVSTLRACALELGLKGVAAHKDEEELFKNTLLKLSAQEGVR